MNNYLSEKDIKQAFGLLYKRKNFGSINQMGTAGFYPERQIFEILRLIKVIYSSYFEGNSFIDIGCGIGNILFAIKQIGFKGSINGIEINYDLVKLARNILPQDIKIIHADARNFSFNEFDRLYSFNPFQIKPGKAYISIWETLESGTIWLETKPAYVPRSLLKDKKTITIPHPNRLIPSILIFK